MKLSGILGVLFALALVAGCGEGNSVTEAPKGTVVGQVVSSATSAPVSGAIVKTDSDTATTTADGKFSVTAPVGDRTIVRVAATGFAEAFPVARVTTGQATNLGVKLVPIGVTETLLIGAGGTVSNSTARLTIPANGLVPQSGGTPAGSVTVSLTPLNPAVDTSLMPGGFNGISAGGGSARPIESFGALLIDIRDSAGTRYNLAPGKTATIRIPVGPQSANPPDTIPLWFFDEIAGVWQEEGTATLQGLGSNQFYEGTVTRVSYWNADLVLDTISVSGCVKDANNQPVANALVQTEGIDYTGTAFDSAAADGTFSVAMRKSSRAKLGLFEFDQQTFNLVPVSNTVNVGPSATDITLPNCLVKQPGPLTITTTALPNGTIGVAYNQILAASGGVPGYGWSLNTGSNLDSIGLGLDQTGIISGTPTVDGTKTITIKVTDSTGTSKTKDFTLTIAKGSTPPPPPPPPASLTIRTTALPSGTVGSAYAATVEATGGTGAKSWSISSGTLPAELSINKDTGAISGTPKAAGAVTITIRVEDSGTPPQSSQKAFDLTITEVPPPPPTCGVGTVNCLTVENAPPDVRGTFEVDPAQTVIKNFGISSGPVMIEINDPSNPAHQENLTIAVGANNLRTVVFQDGASSFSNLSWGCSTDATNAAFSKCEGLTVDRSAGTATFTNVVLSPVFATQSVTLNGTVKFTPF